MVGLLTSWEQESPGRADRATHPQTTLSKRDSFLDRWSPGQTQSSFPDLLPRR